MLTAEIFSDCGPSVGLGHLRRCLVLADALRNRGVECRFCIPDPKCSPIVTDRGFVVRQVDRQAPSLRASDMLIADAYGIDRAQTVAWRGLFLCRLVFDDLGDRPVEAETLLNHNLYGADIDYRGYSAGLVLGGPEYSLVGAEFCRLADRRKTRPQIRALAFFGAGDDGTIAMPVVHSVLVGSEVDVDLVVSPMKPVAPELRSLAEAFPGRLMVYRGAALHALMEGTDLYLGAAGVTLLEALAAGMIPVACCAYANQRLNIGALRRRGFEAFDTPDAEGMASTVARLVADGVPAAERPRIVDCSGADRVADQLLAFVDAPGRKEVEPCC